METTGTNTTSDNNNNNEDETLLTNNNNNTNSTLLTCAFNQDGGCLAIGTTNGFSVHNLYPHYAVSVQRQLNNGGIGLIEMLFRCNLIILVGGGPQPYTPTHRVLIHDDHQGKPIGELSFRQIVLCVKLRKDSIAVALRDRVYVYHLTDLSLRDKIYTSDNPYGLLSVSTEIHDMVLACPSVTKGHVRVELYGSRKTVLMEAHESELRGLALTADGMKLATASEKGTLIRVFDVMTSSCIHEFRRGIEHATITCLSWSWDHTYLACTSDKGTAHIFQLQEDENSNDNGKKNSNKKESTSITQMIFSSVIRSVEGDAKKSVCQIRGVPHPHACTFIAAAAPTNLIAIAGWDADGNGVLMISEFKPNEEPKRIGYHVLCKSSKHDDESEEARRRRRLRGGWTPDMPSSQQQQQQASSPEGGRLYVGERLEILEKGMEQITFEEDLDDEFVSVSTIQRQQRQYDDEKKKSDDEQETTELSNDKKNNTDVHDNGNNNDSNNNNNNNALDSSTVSDSMRTEPLDDTGTEDNSS